MPCPLWHTDRAMSTRTAHTDAVSRTWRRDAQRNHDALLAAAAEVFATRGLDATLDDVADHAGVGVGTAYRHFENKNALIDALFESNLDEITKAAEDALSIPDPWDALTGFLASVIERQVCNRGLRQVLQSRAGEERVARARERMAPLTDRLLDRAKAAGMVRPDVTATDLGLLMMMLAQIGDISRPIRPTLWRRYYTLVLDAIREQGTTLRPRPLTSGEFDSLIASLKV